MKNTTTILLLCILILPIITGTQQKVKKPVVFTRIDTLPDGTIIKYAEGVKIKSYPSQKIIDDWDFYLTKH